MYLRVVDLPDSVLGHICRTRVQIVVEENLYTVIIIIVYNSINKSVFSITGIS